MDVALLILKIAGLGLATVCAVISMRFPLKTKSGNLNYWGKRANVGTVLGAAIAVAGMIAEDAIKRREDQASAKRNLEATQRLERIMNDLSRSMQPMQTIRLFANITLPTRDEEFKPYIAHVNQGVETYLTRGTLDPFDGVQIRTTLPDANGKSVPTSLVVHAGTRYFPSEQISPLVGRVARVRSGELAFYKQPIAASDFRPNHYGFKPDADLRVGFDEIDALHLGVSLNDSAENRSYFLTGWFVSGPRDGWADRTSRVIAVPDLANAQLFLSFSAGKNLDTEYTNSSGHTVFVKGGDVQRLRGRMRLSHLTLEIGSRRLETVAKDWIQHTTADGQPFWEYRFGDDPIPPRREVSDTNSFWEVTTPGRRDVEEALVSRIPR